MVGSARPSASQPGISQWCLLSCSHHDLRRDVVLHTHLKMANIRWDSQGISQHAHQAGTWKRSIVTYSRLPQSMCLCFSDTIAFLWDTFSTLIPRIFALQVVMVCDPAHTIRQYLKVGDQNWQAFANVSQHLRQSVDSAKPLWFPTQAAWRSLHLLQLAFKVSTCLHVGDILRLAGHLRGPHTLM